MDKQQTFLISKMLLFVTELVDCVDSFKKEM
jgi:hypothetical protein